MEDCAIDFNAAVPPWDDDFPMAFTGGGSLSAARLSVRRCRFSRNHATYGGGVTISSVEMEIVDSTFEANRSQDPDWYDELGLGSISGAGMLRNCEFLSNSSSRTCMDFRGGDASRPLSFVECVFKSNSAAYPSADLIVLRGDVRFESCHFGGNYADYAVLSGPARVFRSVFDDNYAVRGMIEPVGGAIVDGCYFARNSPCFYISDDSFTRIQNSIFCNNPGGVIERHSDGPVLVMACTLNRNGWILSNFADSAVDFRQNQFCGSRQDEFWGPWNDLGGNSFCERDLADFNGDGVVDTSDVIEFQAAWAARDPPADANADGRIDSRDWVTFLNVWATDEC
jgi:hypothetical protein